MIISVNWLKQFTQIDASIDELCEVIGARLVEIESVDSIGAKYQDVRIVRVVECAPIEDSDHLNLTRIDDGGAVNGVERGDDGLVQVVCGAPNVRAGMLAAWLPPGSTVPNSAHDDEPFVLGARKLRGHTSNGMLASARELDLFDDHDGIVEVDKEIAPGTLFMAAYALDDRLLDIENKSLTHRPDTFGVVGFAREVAAIAGKGFQTPDWLESLTPAFEAPRGERFELSVGIDDPALSQRYQAVVLTGADQTARTPLDVQTYLSRSGVRPISPIVDVTNYLMLLTGQPLHAFDYDKVTAIGGTHLHVRAGQTGETLALLDGRTIELSPEDIVIAAGDRPIALAGAMGGAATEIDAHTKTIIVESATFNLYKLRATQMRHGIFSEAITRFTKGQPAALTAPVLAHAVRLLTQLTGAEPASDMADEYVEHDASPTLTVPLVTINDVLGSRFTTSDALETLRNVEFIVEADNDTLTVTPPYWRTDIHRIEDVIEEVGRLNGFDTIEPHLPQRDFTAVYAGNDQRLRETVRNALAAAGANEVLTYSFVHGDLLRRAGQSPNEAYALANALSPDLQYYRQSLTPSLLDKVNANQRQRYDEFGLFEFGKTHQKEIHDSNEPDVPAELARLGFVYAASDKRASERGSAYYTVRRYVDVVLHSLHIEGVTFGSLEQATIDHALSAPFEPRRAAAIYVAQRCIGVVGEYKKTVASAFKLPAFSAGFELLTDELQTLARSVGSYQPLSRFPGSEADVTFVVSSDTPYAAITAAVNDALVESNAVQAEMTPGDIYEQGYTLRNVTIHLALVSRERTLTKDDVSTIVARVTSEVSTKLNARVV